MGTLFTNASLSPMKTWPLSRARLGPLLKAFTRTPSAVGVRMIPRGVLLITWSFERHTLSGHPT